MSRLGELTCSSKKWILTDFFDTLVHRKYSERIIREMWAREVSDALSRKIPGSLILKLRNNAAKIAASESDREETSYYEIISKLYVLLHAELELSKKEFVNLCLRIEIDIEARCLYIDEEVFFFLSEQKKNGKKIALVSDFYLSKENIKYFLQHLKIAELFDKIYVSSEFGLKKATGNLYDVVIKELGVPNSLIMIGDNKRADVDMARSKGIDGYWAKWNNTYSENRIQISLNEISRSDRQVPFSNYSFLFYLYIERIYNRLLDIKPQKVFFLAREGFFLKQLFDEYQKGKKVVFESVYIYVSRKSTLLASLNGENENDFISIFNSYKDLDAVSFLRNLSFSEDEIFEVTKKLSFDKDKTFYDFRDTPQFHELLMCPQFKKIINQKCSENKKLFYDYMKQNGIEKEKEIVLIDVGWKGTIQDNIYSALDEIYIVRGLYLGYENYTGLETNSNIKEGLIFSRYPSPSMNCDIWDFETHLIEQMLAAPHGSTYGYKRVENGIDPILEEYSPEDQELYSIAVTVQYGIALKFKKICMAFNISAYNTDDLEMFFLKKHMQALLLLNNACIQFEKVALTAKTNNFGWFKKIPTRSSRKEKLISMLADLKRLNTDGFKLMKFLNYFAVKLNARKKYVWKILVYRMAYGIELVSRRIK